MKQSKKLFATAFAIWAMFIMPILAQSVVETRNDGIVQAESAGVIDSLKTQEPPGVPETPPGEIMTASYYGSAFHGRRTASGEVYNQNELTCAHRTLPFKTILKVTNPQTGKFVVVRVNDRGPFHRGREIDLSYAAAKEIGMIAAGVMKVEVSHLPETAALPQVTVTAR